MQNFSFHSEAERRSLDCPAPGRPPRKPQGPPHQKRRQKDLGISFDLVKEIIYLAEDNYLNDLKRDKSTDFNLIKLLTAYSSVLQKHGEVLSLLIVVG